MHKIIIESVDAFWKKVPYSKSNTQVIVHDNGVEYSYHGNCIASLQQDFLTISSCGWYTLTTASRLNAIVSKRGFFINRKKGKWFINNLEWDGKPIKL